MTQIVALRSLLRRDQEAGYDAAHARIPDELIEAHRRAGIHDSGSRLAHARPNRRLT